METLIMRGKPVADAYRETIMQRVANALGKGRKVTLAIIVVGDDPASHVYKDRLMKLAESMGIYVKELLYPADTKQEDLLRDIARMNHNRYVTGVLPMMPMPKPLDSDTIGAAAAIVSASARFFQLFIVLILSLTDRSCRPARRAPAWQRLNITALNWKANMPL